MGQGIYCAFALINVTKHGACRCAPRTLSPPHADSHELGGNRHENTNTNEKKTKKNHTKNMCRYKHTAVTSTSLI